MSCERYNAYDQSDFVRVILYMARANQPITMPMTSMMKISSDLGMEIGQNNNRISTTAAFWIRNSSTTSTSIRVAIKRAFNLTHLKIVKTGLYSLHIQPNE